MMYLTVWTTVLPQLAVMMSFLYSDQVVVTMTDIDKAVRELDYNKSSGTDNIYAEHLKYCSKRTVLYLSMCLTSFFVHGFLPSSMITVALVSLIKNKNGNINSSDNYRSIALASTVSKIVKKIILARMYDNLLTSCNQFGFKCKLGTDMCIYVLK